MDARIVAAQVAAPRINLPDPLTIPRPNRDECSVCIATAQCRINRTDHDPVAALGRYVSEYASPSRNGCGDKIHGTVIVDVAICQSAPHLGIRAEAAVPPRNVLKSSVAIVHQKLVA